MTDAIPHADGEIASREEPLSLEGIVRDYADLVYHVALRMLGDEDDARDIGQEVFIRVHRALPGFRGDSQVSTWIYRIAVNTVLNRLRRRKLRRSKMIPMADLDPEKPERVSPQGTADWADPEEQYRQTEIRGMVQEALLEVKPKFRAILVLKECQGLSYVEISEILGIAVGTVKSRLARAREAIRPHLEAAMRAPGGAQSGSQEDQKGLKGSQGDSGP